MDSIRIYNSLSDTREKFEPDDPPRVKMYVCGPTVYDDCHVGHGRAYVCFDVVRRFLEYSGYDVKYVLNFTDIDDKTINRAEKQDRSYREVASEYTEKFFRTMDALNIRRADVHPTVSGHVSEIIDHVQGLLEAGMAYEVEGDVYFKVEEFDEYGILSGQDVDEMLEGERVEVEENKRSPLDFALWKSSGESEPGWDSPWGRGRPGWHIECSVMGRTHLGDTLDIHGGGRDLTFPHHENEIAQSQGLTGQRPVRYWMHNGFVTIDDEKMSKSLGNFYTLAELYERFSPEVIRYFILTRHYRSPIDFSFDRLEEAREAFQGLKTFRDRLRRTESRACGPVDFEADWPSNSGFREQFLAAMRDDFNTAEALGKLSSWTRDWNGTLDDWESREVLNRRQQEAVTEARQLFDEFTGEILGLSFASESTSSGETESEELLDLLVQVRERSRDRGDYEVADWIRDQLRQLGFEIKDSPRGTRWERLDE